MADIRLTCDETPLAWPANVAVTDLNICKNCGLIFNSPAPGSGRVLTRRAQDGVGDGLNLEESGQTSVDYRGQRYALEEVIFHTRGMHIFPGMSDTYPAEVHIHLRTNAEPKRALTIIVPVSHLVKGPGLNYFQAYANTADGLVPPVLSSIFTPKDQFIQFLGPDVRGRTAEHPVTPACDKKNKEEREFLMMLGVAQINHADLFNIKTKGSASSYSKDEPAEPVPAKTRITVARDRMIRISKLASPGLLSVTTAAGKTPEASPSKELECKPVKVVNGRDVIDMNGASVDIYRLLGISGEVFPKTDDSESGQTMKAMRFVTLFVGVMLGLVFADWLFGFLWTAFLTGSRVVPWEPIKIWIFLLIASVLATAMGVFQMTPAFLN